jgi:glutamate--cysteine ligase
LAGGGEVAQSTALEHAYEHRSAADEGLRQLLRGIEKESLRVDASSHLATTPHPTCLGSPLTHPTITTDFSEAQLELITGVSPSAADTLAQLRATHRFVVHCLGEERLWASSMPGRLPEDRAIPVGRYGSSNVGMAKTVYRRGLGRTLRPHHANHFRYSLQLFSV